jgi:hypothetical protein
VNVKTGGPVLGVPVVPVVPDGGPGPPGVPGVPGLARPARWPLGWAPGAAVADGVAVLVGDGDAPGGPGAAGRGGDQVPGQGGVGGANSVHLAGP